jgi:hypothetical protein
MQKKCLLQPAVQWRTFGQTLDSGDFTSGNLSSGNQTRANRGSVEQYRAGSAVARVAPYFGSRQFEIISQHAGESPRPGCGYLDGAAVDEERNQIRFSRVEFLSRGHQRLPKQASSARCTRVSDASRR